MADFLEIAQAGDQAFFEPQRQHSWRLSIQGLTNDQGKVTGDLEIGMRSAFVPTESNEEVEIPRLNYRVWVAGRAQYEAGTIILNDYVDRNTAATMAQWRRQVWNPETGQIGLAAVYKKTATIDLLGPDLAVGSSRKWTLRGVWPQQVNYGTLDYGASDIVQIEVNLRYDAAIPLFAANSTQTPE